MPIRLRARSSSNLPVTWSQRARLTGAKPSRVSSHRRHTNSPVGRCIGPNSKLRNRNFLCNDIQELRETGAYKNSHAVDGKALPYNSTVVRPVRKNYEDQPPASVSDWQDIVAHL